MNSSTQSDDISSKKIADTASAKSSAKGLAKYLRVRSGRSAGDVAS